MCHIEPLGPEMYVVVGRDVVEINCYPLGGVAKGQIVTICLHKSSSRGAIIILILRKLS